MEKTYKRVPHNLTLSNKIINGLIEGRIVSDKDGIVYIELPKETPICNNPDSPKCKVCSNWHCNDCKYNIPNKFKPFDKVLVRDAEEDEWQCNLFSHLNSTGSFRTMEGDWIYCIPYEGNEHLVGTTNKPR